MEKEKVLQALDYCTKALNNGANLCDNCPMMEAGCDARLSSFNLSKKI